MRAHEVIALVGIARGELREAAHGAAEAGRRMRIEPGLARDQDALTPVVRERIVEREARALHTGDPLEPLLEIAVQRGQPVSRDRRGRPSHRHQDPPVALEPEVLPLEIAEAAAEHGRTGDEHDRERRLHDE